MQQHVIEWAHLPDVEVRPGVAKRAIEGEDASLVMVRVAAGVSAGKHHHEEEQFVQVISGTGTLETQQGERRFGPGSVFHFPPRTWHAAQFETDTVLVETNLNPVSGRSL